MHQRPALQSISLNYAVMPHERFGSGEECEHGRTVELERIPAAGRPGLGEDALKFLGSFVGQRDKIRVVRFVIPLGCGNNQAARFRKPGLGKTAS